MASIDIERAVPSASLTAPLPWAGIEERQLDVLGCQINYIDEGSGEAIIFLHNGGGFWQIWSHQIRHFSRTHQVLAFDWPGFGESTMGNEPLTVDFAARILAAFVEAVGIDRFVLVGNCIGASTAIRYQNQHPDAVAKLVIMNICPGIRLIRFPPMRPVLFKTGKRFREGLGRVMKAIATSRIAARQFPGILFGKTIAKQDPLYQKYVAKFREDRINDSRMKLLFSVNSFTLADFIRDNDTIRNALLIWGRDNRVASLKGQGLYHQRLCQIDHMEVIPDSGHLTMYEAPDRVNQLIEQYISADR